MNRVTSALSLAALAATTLVASSCTDPLPAVPQRTVAYALLAAQRNEANDAYVLRASAFFFRTNNVTFLQSGLAPDACTPRDYVPPSTGADSLPSVKYLDAGSAVALSTSGGTTASLLAQTDAFGKKFYAPAGNAAISPFTPGEIVTLTVPGGSGTDAFPQTEIVHRTVEPFTFDPVSNVSNATGGGLKLTWTVGDTAGTEPPTGTNPTGMLVALRYAAAGTGSPDVELFCSLADDGEFIIPSSDAKGWFNSQAVTHEVEFTRWRADLVQAGAYYKQTISTLTVPTPIAATAAVVQ